MLQPALITFSCQARSIEASLAFHQDQDRLHNDK